MPTKGEQTRDRIVQTAADLIQRQGYHATGLNQIIKESKTPKGSLYFHFPNGKEEILAEAIVSSGQQISQLIAHALAESSNIMEAIHAVISFLTDELVQTDYTKGCPIATVALEAAPSFPKIQKACEEVYSDWQEQIIRHLISLGNSETKARKKALWLLSAIEGALILCKSSLSITPLENVRGLLDVILIN